ncbi:MAG: flippase [Bacteroidota bacterium]
MKSAQSSYWLKSGAFSLLERISLQLFRFGSFYLLVRGLDKGAFGTWTLFLIICSFFEVLRVGFIQNALVRALSLADQPETRKQINSASLTLNILLSVVITILLILLYYLEPFIWDAAPLNEMFLIYILTSLLLLPFFHFQFIQQAHLTFHGIFLSTLVRHSAFFGYVCWVYFDPELSFNLIQLAFFQAFAAGLGAIVSILTAWKYVSFSGHVSMKWMMRLVHFGKYVTGTNLGMILMKFLDQILLGAMVSRVAVADYSTAVRITNLVEVPTQAVASIVYPQSAKKGGQKDGNTNKQLFEKSVGIILAMIIPGGLFVWLFPEWVLNFVAGDRYLDAVPILRLTLISGLFVPFSRQFSTIMDGIGKPKVNFQLTLGGAVLNFIFLLICIPLWEEIGAVIATILAYVCIVVAGLVILSRELGVDPLGPIRFAFRLYLKGFWMIWSRTFGRLSSST